MEKSIKINIAGIIFQISEEGYEVLRDYLQEISSRLRNIEGGSEMVDDIEARIAEIFQSKPKWQTAVISREEVDEMISTMGSPEDIAGALESDPEAGYYQRREKKLFRSNNNRIIGGVCSGISDYTGIDAVWIRILFVLFTLVYLTGALVYIILWIALPTTSTVKYSRPVSKTAKEGKAGVQTAVIRETSSSVGNAFNEIFKAFGKFFVILFRVIIAIIGLSLIISGFTTLFSFIFISFFHSTLLVPDFIETSVFYLPSFFSFLVDPPIAVWLVILSSIVIILPLLAIIYWGIRMVFQFRARDLMLNIIMLIIWVLSSTALAIILFTQGISFSNSGRSSETIMLPQNDTLYVSIDNRVSELDYEKSIHLPFEEWSLYLDEDERLIYGSPEINIYHTNEDPYMQIIKYSNGANRTNAIKRAEDLIYNINIDDNRIKIDDYYTIPEGNRWSGAFVKIRLYLPDGYTIYFDDDIEDIFVHNKGKFGIVQGDMKKVLHHLERGHKPTELFQAAMDGKDMGIRIPLRGNATSEKPVFSKIHEAMGEKRKKLDAAYDELITEEQVDASYS